MSRLVAAPRRIEFVCLRTDPSPQIALHLASQRRSYLRLRSLWLPPTWTLTMLIWRLHGRTHSGQARTSERAGIQRRLIGVGNGFRRPRPPNRACGSPAHGSPVGGFLIGIDSLTARLRPW